MIVLFPRGNDENSRSKRMHIYITLLKQMAPEHLLATFAKVCAEILAAASDGMLCLEDVTGQSVLQVIILFYPFIYLSFFWRSDFTLVLHFHSRISVCCSTRFVTKSLRQSCKHHFAVFS